MAKPAETINTPTSASGGVRRLIPSLISVTSTARGHSWLRQLFAECLDERLPSGDELQVDRHVVAGFNRHALRARPNHVESPRVLPRVGCGLVDRGDVVVACGQLHQVKRAGV